MIKRALTCPIIRKATARDAQKIGKVMFNSQSNYFRTTFKNNLENGKNAIIDAYSRNPEGIYVLTEADEIISVMKLQLPGIPLNKAISFKTFIHHLGWIRGVKSAFLLSQWDEYVNKKNEVYLEFVYVAKEWSSLDAFGLMIEKAIEMATELKAAYISYYVIASETEKIELLSDRGFSTGKIVSSLIGRFLSSIYKWNKCTIQTVDRGLLSSDLIASQTEARQYSLRRSRSQVVSSIRFMIAMLFIPILYGPLAYIRGFPFASLVWGIVFCVHIAGLLLIAIKKPSLGSILLIIAVLFESSNLLWRAVETNNWLYRSYLIPLALLNFWMAYTIFRAKQRNYLQTVKPFAYRQSS